MAAEENETAVIQRYGVASDLEPIDMGETAAVAITDSYEWS